MILQFFKKTTRHEHNTLLLLSLVSLLSFLPSPFYLRSNGMTIFFSFYRQQCMRTAWLLYESNNLSIAVQLLTSSRAETTYQSLTHVLHVFRSLISVIKDIFCLFLIFLFLLLKTVNKHRCATIFVFDTIILCWVLNQNWQMKHKTIFFLLTNTTFATFFLCFARIEAIWAA